mgnify:CR=1 FL=1
MNVEKMRKEFEAAYAEFSVRAKGFSDDEVKIALMRDDDDGYLYGAANEAWCAWQTSRYYSHPTFPIGSRVRKIKGSRWQGRVVGTYSTELTPEGYAVESETEHGSVQIYPAHALELVSDK